MNKHQWCGTKEFFEETLNNLNEPQDNPLISPSGQPRKFLRKKSKWSVQTIKRSRNSFSHKNFYRVLWETVSRLMLGDPGFFSTRTHLWLEENQPSEPDDLKRLETGILDSITIFGANHEISTKKAPTLLRFSRW